MEYKRHYLLEITENGREFAFERLKESITYLDNLEQIRKLVVEGYGSTKVPGIIRREENEGIKGTIPVGFSSPYLDEGRRLRIPAFIPEKEIIKIITPYEVIEHSWSPRTKCLQALEEVKILAHDMGIKLGVWGSTGLEVYTAVPYTHDDSDLDLLICVNDFNILESFYQSINQVGRKYATKIDLELDLPTGYGVKAAEIFMETEEVLGKSVSDVKLISRKTVMGLFNN